MTIILVWKLLLIRVLHCTVELDWVENVRAVCVMVWMSRWEGERRVARHATRIWKPLKHAESLHYNLESECETMETCHWPTRPSLRPTRQQLWMCKWEIFYPVLLILSSKTLTPYQKPKFLKFRILFLHTGESCRSVTRSFLFFCRKLTVYGTLDFGADFFLYFSFSFCVLITPRASPTPTAPGPLKANRHLGEWSERLLGSIMTTSSSKH